MYSRERSAYILSDRARIVCSACHARKVRCDLASQPGGVCHGCQRHGFECRRRIGRRRLRAGSSSQSETLEGHTPAPQQGAHPIAAENIQRPPSVFETEISHDIIPQQGERVTILDNREQGVAGLSEDMLDVPPPLPAQYQKIMEYSDSITNQLLSITNANSMPPQPRLRACFDSYYEYLFHRIPVLDRSDIELGSPRRELLVCQALCLVGSLLQHPKRTSDPHNDIPQLFVRVKVLINASLGRDFLMVLKALCLVMTWNIGGSNLSTFDSSWHWLGQASRLLIQMALHKNKTYSISRVGKNPRVVRRIVWCILTQDKLYSACYGRPCILRSSEYDLRPLTADDFETRDEKALLAVAWSQLGSILGHILELPNHRSERTLNRNEVLTVVYSFRDWADHLPEDIRLYDATGRRAYRPGVYQVHMFYFAVIIYFLSSRRENESQLSKKTQALVSLVASSCMVELIDDMIYRDDINYLSGIFNWFFMLAACPQLKNRLWESRNGNVAGGRSQDLYEKQLDIIITALKVMEIKTPEAANMLKAIARFRMTLPITDFCAQQQQNLQNSSVEWSGDAVLTEMHDWAMEEVSIKAFKDVFPFPESISPRMDIFHNLDKTSHDIGAASNSFEDFTDVLLGSSFSDGFSFIEWPA